MRGLLRRGNSYVRASVVTRCGGMQNRERCPVAKPHSFVVTEGSRGAGAEKSKMPFFGDLEGGEESSPILAFNGGEAQTGLGT